MRDRIVQSATYFHIVICLIIFLHECIIKIDTYNIIYNYVHFTWNMHVDVMSAHWSQYSKVAVWVCVHIYIYMPRLSCFYSEKKQWSKSLCIILIWSSGCSVFTDSVVEGSQLAQRLKGSDPEYYFLCWSRPLLGSMCCYITGKSHHWHLCG